MVIKIVIEKLLLIVLNLKRQPNKKLLCNPKGLSVKVPIQLDSNFQPQANFLRICFNNHNRVLQVAVAVAVDQNFLKFCGRSLKSRLVRQCLQHRTVIQLRKIEQIGCGVCGQTANYNRSVLSFSIS